MQLLAKLKASVADPYSVKEDTYICILEDRGLTATDAYSVEMKQAFELSKADLLMTLVTFINTSEGGFQKGATDKLNFIKMANTIYKKYDDPAGKKITVPRGRAPQRW